jgi:NADPH:quinone reductase-like Zn-dependent oxidoreductase
VRVHAAGVDRGVWHLMAGMPYVMRLAGFGIRAPKTRCSAMTWPGASRRSVHTPACFGPGTRYSGRAGVPSPSTPSPALIGLASKPANVSFEEAAAVLISGYAALQAVREHGGVRAGQRVLIMGAGGGVGRFAVQIAKADGAEVTGVCSTAKIELVHSIGADHVIDYTREEFADGRNRYDVILDIAGNRPCPSCGAP